MEKKIDRFNETLKHNKSRGFEIYPNSVEEYDTDRKRRCVGKLREKMNSNRSVAKEKTITGERVDSKMSCRTKESSEIGRDSDSKSDLDSGL